MRRWILVLCWAADLIAQQRFALVIDGKLTDSVWRNLKPESLAPSEPGVPAAFGGDIRAVVAGRYLYVAARLPEPTGRFTARLTGRNPSWEEEDALRILVGANIGYTDRIVQINPFGAYSIEKAVHVRYTNEATFPYSDEWQRDVVYRNSENFLIATSIGERNWDVEAAIPLNELSAPGSDNIFASIERIRATRPGSPQQRWHWPPYGPAAKIPLLSPVKWEAPAVVFHPIPITEQEPPLEVGRREIPPLGAGWNDPAWRDVPVRILRRDEPQARPPRVPTEVKLVHDGRILAVLARCIEPGSVVASVKENDGPVNQEDSFHVYLATSGSAYVQLVVNPLGYLLDNSGFAGGQRLSRAREWSSGARTVVRQEQGAWIARMDIPLQRAASALGETGTPAAWRILLLRFRPGRDGEPRETSVLPVIQSETPLCPARYRRLTLVDRDPNVLRPREPEAVNFTQAFETRVLSAEQRKQMDLAGMLQKHILGRVRKNLEAEKAAREQLKSRADWERFRAPRLEALSDFIGKFPPRTPLRTQVTKEFSGSGYLRQDLVYESRPDLWVTANLYLPATPRPNKPGIVVIHSHHRPRTQAELQDMGILWARAGCAVLIMDQIGHGERLETYPWNREGYHARYVEGMQLYLAGESLIKWIVWDVMRGIDLLLERPDINKSQIILLGAVAAGGDPAAVAAALDPRISAVAPFNFGEATPRSGGRGRWPPDLADPGSGSWESTRNLPHSIASQFLPWMICASVAPRRLVYSYEMGWEVEKQPAWERYRKIFDFYGAPERLAEAHGFGAFPGPGECANIGPAQRETLYPSLKRWFDIPIPGAEPDDRRPEAELASLTPAIAAKLGMRTLHDLAGEVAGAKLDAARAALAKLSPNDRRRSLQVKLAAKLGEIEPNRHPAATTHWKRPWRSAEIEAVTLEVEPGITEPLLLLRPQSADTAQLPVVVAVAEGGKEGFFDQRASEIEALLKSGLAVCLPDVRGTGETSPDPRHGPASAEISLAATELMLGNTLLGARVKDLRSVIAYLASRPGVNSSQMALWGDSFAPVNPPRILLDEMQNWQIGPVIQRQAEPLGGLLALLGALYEDNVRTVAVRGGLAGYLSVLDDAFAYIPEDVVAPGLLEVADVSDIAAALAPRPLLLEGLVDGKNRLASERDLQSTLRSLHEAYGRWPNSLVIRSRQAAPRLPEWLSAHLSH